MRKRYVTIWFRYLKTDWFARREPSLKNLPFILATPDHGRMTVTSTNGIAQTQGVYIGMSVADARAIIPSLQVSEDDNQLPTKLLNGLATYCIRYTPGIAVDLPDSLTLDATGCAHLWGGEEMYLGEIIKRLSHFGYQCYGAMADTIAASWAVCHFGETPAIINAGQHYTALLLLPTAALRLEPETITRLNKLGLRNVQDFIGMPRTALRRRFGPHLLQRIDAALGTTEDIIIPIQPIEPYEERLPCMEPIVSAKGICIALERLLDTLCHRLSIEQKGLRKAVFCCYRMDGKKEKIEIGTNRSSCNSKHLFKLFEIKIETIEPAAGIELFTLTALQVEDLVSFQETLWENTGGINHSGLSELLDRIAGKMGVEHIRCYEPAEHYWPERSFKISVPVTGTTSLNWRLSKPRPLQILHEPTLIEVTAPIPDYPPMMFRYKGILHKIITANGPERIEQEWWLQTGQHRDYYCVEDETGCRYWLFRLGHYDAAKTYQWFLHGFFA